MGKRITVRLDGSLSERLQQKCSELGCDVSFVVRKALEEFMAPENEVQSPGTVGALVMPEEAFMLTGRYRAWSGDLRAELKKRIPKVGPKPTHMTTMGMC